MRNRSTQIACALLLGLLARPAVAQSSVRASIATTDRKLRPIPLPSTENDRPAPLKPLSDASALDPSKARVRMLPSPAATGHSIRRASGENLLVPMASDPKPQGVELSRDDNDRVTLVANGAELKSILRMIADHHELNLVVGPEVGGPVTVSIRDARLDEILDAILGVAGFTWHQADNLLYVTGGSAAGMDPRVQGRTVRVYRLDYVTAADIEPIVTSLLSPAGSSFITESESADQMKTHETLVVEDVPRAQRRIADAIAQLNVPPPQVLIEAHVLQIALGEDQRHGIDLRSLVRLHDTRVRLSGNNFTEDNETGPYLAVNLAGTDMDGVLQVIRENTNSRTLASPKLSVINRQEGRIQIGQRLPYSVSTTTQTTTIESVEFLEVGIVLSVKPVITRDGNVLMEVMPKVSGGKITANGFPEEETTEVTTTILMPDGGGVVIGGLIREDNIHNHAMIPGLGQIPYIGRLFQRRSDECRRNELVVALVAHVMPDYLGPRLHEAEELQQTLPPYAAESVRHAMVPQVPTTVDSTGVGRPDLDSP
jgi:type II secretory pathway component GspD/PulD (secretin)